MSKVYTFREITDIDELERSFKLRYEVYADSIHKVVLNENRHRIDIDSYDFHSKHYSITAENNIAGHLRMVLPKRDFTNLEAISLASRYNLPNEKVSLATTQTPYPFLSYEGIPTSFKRFYAQSLSNNLKIIEASRLIIHPDNRTHKASRFVSEAILAYYIFVKKTHDIVVITCADEFSNFYKEYGLCPIADNEIYEVKGMRRSCLYLKLLATFVPEKYRNNFEAMAKEYMLTGKIEREL